MHSRPISQTLKTLPARLDGRVLLPVSMGTGLAIWHGGGTGLAAHLAIAVALMLVLCRIRRESMDMALVLLRFVILWTAILLLTGLWQGLPTEEALHRSLLTGGRLGALSGLGFVLAQALSARSLGLAVCWYLRPVLGDRAWRPGLALALMIHFLPLCLNVFTGLRQTMELRRIRGGFLRRSALLPAAGLRIVAGRTWKQALAVSARGLDTPEAWTSHRPLAPKAVFLGLISLAISWSLALI